MIITKKTARNAKQATIRNVVRLLSDDDPMKQNRKGCTELLKGLILNLPLALVSVVDSMAFQLYLVFIFNAFYCQSGKSNCKSDWFSYFRAHGLLQVIVDKGEAPTELTECESH